MRSRDFCFWLQGHFELQKGATAINAEQAIIIRNHLELVFKHEIDPSMPDPTGELQEIHDGTRPPPSNDIQEKHDWPPVPAFTPTPIQRPDTQLRC